MTMYSLLQVAAEAASNSRGLGFIGAGLGAGLAVIGAGIGIGRIGGRRPKEWRASRKRLAAFRPRR